MKDLDKFAIAALPMAYHFYKSSIEGDGGIIEFEGEYETNPSIDLKIIADYAYLMAKAMQNSRNIMEQNSWIEGHDQFIEKLITPKEK